MRGPREGEAAHSSPPMLHALHRITDTLFTFLSDGVTSGAGINNFVEGDPADGYFCAGGRG